MPAVPLPSPDDDNDRWLLSQLADPGWAVISIPEDDEGPGYTFTVGLFHTFDLPELVFMGFNPTEAMNLLNAAVERLRGGQSFTAGSRVTDLMSCQLAIVPVDPRHHHEYLGYARWLYRKVAFPVLQLVWPDNEMVFPWEAGYDTRLFTRQRLLGPADGPAGAPRGQADPAGHSGQGRRLVAVPLGRRRDAGRRPDRVPARDAEARPIARRVG
jgi:hypothetical protein